MRSRLERALFVGAIAVALFIFGGKKFETITGVLSFFFVANYTISFVSVFVLRKREPEKERPYRAFAISADDRAFFGFIARLSRRSD